MESTGAPQRPIDIGGTINETFSMYGQNFAVLLGSAIAVFIVVGLLAGLVQSAGGAVAALLAAVIRLVGYALYTGFIVRLVQDVRDGRRDQTVGDLFSAAMPAIFALIAFGILFGFAVGIGFIFLIVPGLILLTFWSVGAPAIVVEGIGPFQAFGRSWNLVRGNGWSVFGTLIVIFLIVLVIQFVLAAIATPIGDGALIVATIVSTALTAPIFSLAVSAIYFDLGGGPQARETTAAFAPQPPAPGAAN